MANDRYATTPLLGVNVTRRTDDPEFKPGTVVNISGNQLAMYVRALAAVDASSYCTIDQTTTAFYASSVVSGASGTAHFVNATAAFAPGQYGWVLQVAKAAGRDNP